MGPPGAHRSEYGAQSETISPMDHGPRKVKCTYEGCHKRFKDEATMKRHKNKDPDHFYCQRCDLDLEDDMDYLTHQIVSNKHIVCPACGEEFEGSEARDLHVENRHGQKQTLECVGCKMKLTGASAYMAHVGKNECEVITLELYDQMRAEKQIEKDLWDEAMGTNNIVYADSSRYGTETGTNGEGLLMDEGPIGSSSGQHSMSDLDSRNSPLQPTRSESRTSSTKLTTSMTSLTVDRYPPLPVQPRTTQDTGKKEKVPPKPTMAEGDLLDFEQPEERGKPKQPEVQQAPGLWKTTRTASSRLFPPKEGQEKAYPSQSDLSGVPAFTRVSIATGATYGDDTQHPRSNHKSPHVSDSSTTIAATSIPAATRPTNNDPNAPYANVRTASKLVPPSILDPEKYHNDVTDLYECPGKDCKGKFTTAEGFKGHLVTGAHMAGKTQCPSCLKKFRTTWALIAHCESPSRRCTIRKSANYNQILRELTAGLLGTDGHTDEQEVRYVAVPVTDW